MNFYRVCFEKKKKFERIDKSKCGIFCVGTRQKFTTLLASFKTKNYTSHVVFYERGGQNKRFNTWFHIILYLFLPPLYKMGMDYEEYY